MYKVCGPFGIIFVAQIWQSCRDFSCYALGDFTFWLRLSLKLSLSLNFGLSTYLSQKVKWFHWVKTWHLTRIV